LRPKAVLTREKINKDFFSYYLILPKILKRLNRIQTDAEKLMDDFRKLGNHLKNAVSAYDTSEKRLSLFSDKVEKLLETKEVKKLKEG